MSIDSTALQIAIERKQEGEYHLFHDDLRKVHDAEHSIESLPQIYKCIDLVYVLSGRGSALKLSIDHTQVADPEDDYHRMLKGIEIAKKIYASKGVRVPIFYNGRKLHNEHLIEALKRGIFDYPKELFIICPIVPENTIGQAKSFKSFLFLEFEKCSTIAIVSSAYHLPRVSRTFGKQSPTIMDANSDYTSKLEIANLLLFGIDRAFKRPGAEKDLNGEIDAMKNYSSGASPTISRYKPTNTFLNKTDVLLGWSFDLQKMQAQLITNPFKNQSCVALLQESRLINFP